jgi:hypothetical protein
MRGNSHVDDICETGWLDNLNVDDFNRGDITIFDQFSKSINFQSINHRVNVWQCMNWDLGNLTTIDLSKVITIVHSGTVKYTL